MYAPFKIFTEYWKWRHHWDNLCNRCGQCCYIRSLSSTGEVEVDYSAPCDFLEENTHLCRVYENRFCRCMDCKSVNLLQALTNPLLPPDCAYAQTFRVWLKKN